ncbi:MAG: phosphatidylglycerophosphatase A [Betaproteobacteria bacterium]|nr:phosphatidylglycerophosphatase A [Betaproteobacteria bacterium]
MSKPPSIAFLLRHPAHFIACGCGSGLSWFAPGTVGTLFGWLTYPLLRPWMSEIEFAGFLVLAFIGGIFACHRAGVALGEADHGSIVWDEIVSFWAVLFFCPPGLWWQCAAFFLFRFFDIVKPPPASWFDRNLKNGFGVMADDFFAAAYAVLVLALFKFTLERFF